MVPALVWLAVGPLLAASPPEKPRQPAFAPGQDERGPALTRPSVSKAA